MIGMLRPEMTNFREMHRRLMHDWEEKTDL
jgi:hypothetical protein